ncbi:winged helix-turn-helix transcriptional regulator [Kribbella sandramycini]|uniref:DNA-binding transcriptional ArsR family regulator n=1 Tax=Kribbella sandramycini TaxID=60450 RepID=A0A7Y4KYJ8_9ACTN|nr:winged helix-turn-helix domain-containing protein [Kribbella sandramycini]MBB6569117.1 DNA-binding transcriptional ArsR family regulator [Kribbella sandramycini]NOL41040.1 winged helix-turn-helix transcriptional regulator [Kribbella sandramycini]
MPTENRRPTGASRLQAVDHPLRRKLLGLLGVEGPATASILAARTGEMVGNISHHLKVLRTAGVIEEVPELAKDKRERWWRSALTSYAWPVAAAEPGAEMIAAVAEESNVTYRAGLVRDWFSRREEHGEEWIEAAFSIDVWLRLTPARLAELRERLQDVLEEYVDDPSAEPETRPVYVFAQGFPAQP